ncbi:hypothetical protein BWI17_20210 [Betaproteobacteria bacterium GR16-43]|nr:hypothetical protein BWI17_20210 [Betaproteobacteria bacterium GR16-43]
MKETPPALEKRRQPGRLRAIFLAVIVHAVFFAVIVFGVTWQSKPEAPVEAELWKDLPPAVKATKPPEPEPPKPEPPKPEPEPPKPEPVKAEPPKPAPEPPKAKAEPPKPDPAVAEKLEREKREKERKEKLDREKREKQEREAEKKKQDDAKKKREDEKKRIEDERARKEVEQAREAAASARKSEADRFKNAIAAKIRGKANVPDNITGNPQVEVRIRILPGGDVLDAQITRSSGNPAYDAAIERAIRSAAPLPVPEPNSELFPQFRDLRLNIRHER